MKKIIIIIIFLLFFALEAQAGYFMPAYWMYSRSEPIFMKDIANNTLLLQNHDSMEFVFSQSSLFVEDGIVWHSFHWEWVYKRPLWFGFGCGITYKTISVDSLFGKQENYIVVKGDTYDGSHYDWLPWKKISKVYWEIDDPISQNVTLYFRGSQILTGLNTWVLEENLYFLNNTFCDGTNRIWEGDILHLVEYEPNANKIDYWLMFGKGLIRLKISTGEYIWMEVGAY